MRRVERLARTADLTSSVVHLRSHFRSSQGGSASFLCPNMLLEAQLCVDASQLPVVSISPDIHCLHDRS